MIVKTNKVFVSVYQAKETLEVNHVNHVKATELLTREGVSFQIVSGVSHDNREISFVLSSYLVTDHEKNLDFALKLGLLFNQESVLEVHGDDTAVLHTVGGSQEIVGKFIEVDSVSEHSSYIYEPVSNRYFVVER